MTASGSVYRELRELAIGMDGRTWTRLARAHLLPALPGWAVRGRLMFRTPIEMLLVGLSCEPSAFSKEPFTVHAFVQPLYVPADHVAFSLGGRLGRLGGKGDKWWHFSLEREREIMDEVREYIQREALPFLAEVDTPQTVAEYLSSRQLTRGGLPLSEHEAYSWLLAGNRSRASAVLAAVGRTVTLGSPEWVERATERAALVRERLMSDPGAARSLLHDWRNQTMQALRLEAFSVGIAPEQLQR